MVYQNFTVGGVLYHARNHKYIDKVRTKSGKWRYIYYKSRESDARVREFGAKANEKLNRFGRQSYTSYLNTLNNNLKLTKDFGNKNSRFYDSVLNMYKDDIAMAKNNITSYRGKEVASRNEAKIERRNVEANRRKAATAVGDKAYKRIEKAQKKVMSILKKKMMMNN